MTIKTILLHVSDSPRNETYIDAALALAADHQARVTALYTTTLTFYPLVTAVEVTGYVSQATVDQMLAEVKAAEEAAKRLFLDRCEKARIPPEWHGEAGPPVASLSAGGRCTDLLVVGKPDPSSDMGSPMETLPHELVLAAGRPVLVIPHATSVPRFGRRILLAWNGSREATRAAHDSLPFLKKAEAVTVFSVNPPEGRHIPGADITAHLARHDVKATASHTVAEDLAVGDVLLSAVADHGADMLVMGAWGHSRLRELVFGGATRDVLRTMTVPVLMSH